MTPVTTLVITIIMFLYGVASGTATACSAIFVDCGANYTQPLPSGGSAHFIVNVTAPVDPATVEASDFIVNGMPADSFTLENANARIVFHFIASPIQVSNIIHIAAGAFNCVNGPVLEFNCEYRCTLSQPSPTPSI